MSIAFKGRRVAASRRHWCRRAVQQLALVLEHQESLAASASASAVGTVTAADAVSPAEAFRQALELSADAICFGDAQGHFTWTNRRALELTGYTFEELVGKGISALFSEAELNRTPLRYDLLRQGQSVFTERWLQRRDGSLVLVEMHSKMMPDGSFQSILRDITERQRTEEILRRNEARLRLVTDNMEDLVVQLDARQRILFVSPSVTRLLGYSIPEVLTRSAVELVHPEDLPRVRRAAQGAIEAFGPTVRQELRLRNTHGAYLWVEAEAHLFYDAEGAFTGSVLSARNISDRKSAEVALRRSEERYRRFIHNFQGMAYQLNCRTNQLVFLHGKVEAITGHRPEELLQGRIAWPDLIHPDDLARVFEQNQKLATLPGYAANSEYRIIRRDGEVRWVNDIGQSLRDEAEATTLVQGVLYDITERKHAEEAVRLALREWQTTFDAVGDALCLLDADQRIRRCNQAMGKLLGQEESAFRGQHCWQVVHGTREPLPECPVLRMRQSLRRESMELRLGERWFQVSVDPLLNELGVLTGAVHILRDITERKAGEEELRATNEELTALNRIIMACAGSLDLRDTLDKVLDESLNLVGLEGGTLCLVQPDQTLTLAAHRATSEATRRELSERQVRVGECLCGTCARDRQPVILPDPEAVARYASRESLRREGLQFHAALPLVAHNKCLGVLCLFTRTDRKPTDRRLKLLETVTAQVALTIQNAQLYHATLEHAATLEDKVRERTAQLAAANQELEAFSFSVSHDLRAPLRHVYGYAQAIEDHLKERLDPEGRHLLDVIKQASQRMSQLIEDLLSFSRMGRTEMLHMQVDFTALVSEIVRETQRDNPDRQIEWRVAPLPVVRADLALIRQVWINLIGNAVKYTRHQPVARIEVGTVASPPPTAVAGSEAEKALVVAASDQPREVFFFVRDNGVGFNMDYARRLFGVFQRLHSSEQFEGTGIGLANVRRIIHRHGGGVWAESRLDQGATLYFSLPVHETP